MSNLPRQDITIARGIARQIRARGLRSFALLTLEAGRPLALLAAQLVWVTQPVLALVWRPQSVSEWAQFLEQPGSIELLIEQLQSEE